MDEKKLLDLFEGDSNQHIEIILTGDLDERGKRKADYKTVYSAVTVDLWKKHLDGEITIGIKPEIDGKAKWGCIDMDPSSYTGFDRKKFIDIIREYNLPLVPLKSKSGGLHLILFLTDWADQNDLLKVLNKWNERFFLAKEVFPRNKHLGMPYHKAGRTVEHAYDDKANGLDLGQFIEIAYKKRKPIQELLEFKTQKYEPEPDWNEYPPCIQSLLTDKWVGDGRNNIMFNMAVLENKKTEGHINPKRLKEILLERNQQIFVKPLEIKEIDGTVAKSASKKSYNYLCPPKNGFITPICNKELCQKRKLGIGFQVPDIIDQFKDIELNKGVKDSYLIFTYEDIKMTFKTDTDLVDEKSFRTKMLSYNVMWMSLPKPKKGPNPFEMLANELLKKGKENQITKYEDVLIDTVYVFKKEFYERNMILDNDFDKVADEYIVTEDIKGKDYCYFKRSTLEKFIKKSSSKFFSNAPEALEILKCERLDYYKGHKNLWKMELPDFNKNEKRTNVNVEAKQETLTELDDAYHAQQFRTPK
jgi:hypothetical protein